MWREHKARMSVHIETQQVAAEYLGALGVHATLMVHFPSKIKAPEGILLTTYDQLHSQIAKQETTAYAFPSFGAAQSAMKALATTQQTVIFIYECHANTGPVEIAAKVFDTCQRHSPGGGCGPPRGMCLRGGGGPVRVRGDVKLRYSAGELLKAPVPNEP